ncbi:MFS transporter [Actinocatenispora thailandica]|uniref:MFS transporter n=1 Tax=Actinocatenispora thailandica TaxID=227318 RepID=A0A7R7HUR8_9ACTN|nr:MFS transporter [Actinocatenispora thailandica]BCJ33322.1 MFS transporter [Actinocatenispora thailandica]
MPETTQDQQPTRTAVAGAGEPARRRARWLIGAGILLVALNLRPAITSVGALLDQLQSGLSMSGATAGLLTTLPALCFGAFSGLAPRLARRFGADRVLLAAMAALVAGLVLRPLAGSAPVFLAVSVLCLAGIAAGNVTLPVLVRTYFPDRLGLLTGLYTTVLNLGAALASAVAVPVAAAAGGWRGGLALWATIAAFGLLPWLGALRRRQPSPAATAPVGAAPGVRPSRTRLGWALAVYMGTQSLQAYVVFGWLAKIFAAAGYSSSTAGLLVSLVVAVGMPIAFFLPTLAGRTRDQRPYVLLLIGCYVVGYLGLLLAPHAGALAWALLIGVGGGAFPLALLMVGLRARTPAGTAGLSGFVQSVGYLIAAVGPLLVGVLHDATHGWLVPILFLLVMLVPQLFGGLAAGRNRYIEDEARSQSR